MENLRLIIEDKNSAAYNMAADQALLEGLLKGISPPTLRFYQWEKPTVSVGYFQSVKQDLDVFKIKNNGWDIIRRPTGGRAVLHWKEITFCIVFDSGGKSLWDVFKSVHQVLGKGLQTVGINAAVSRAGENRDTVNRLKTPSCFASPSRYELTVNGKKIAGTAQKQVRGVMLIHGSIPIESTYKELYDVMRFSTEKQRKKAYSQGMEKMTSIKDETGRVYSHEELYYHLATAFRNDWRHEMSAGEYRAFEKMDINRLRCELYENQEWVYKK